MTNTHVHRALELCENARRRDVEAVGEISKALDTVVDTLESVGVAMGHYRSHMQKSERHYAAIRQTLAPQTKRRRSGSKQQCDQEIDSPLDAAADASKRPRKRARAHKGQKEQDKHKMQYACTGCRAARRACDHQKPCGRCTKRALACEYEGRKASRARSPSPEASPPDGTAVLDSEEEEEGSVDGASSSSQEIDVGAGVVNGEATSSDSSSDDE